jgi:hypothetical protein
MSDPKSLPYKVFAKKWPFLTESDLQREVYCHLTLDKCGMFAILYFHKLCSVLARACTSLLAQLQDLKLLARLNMDARTESTSRPTNHWLRYVMHTRDKQGAQHEVLLLSLKGRFCTRRSPERSASRSTTPPHRGSRLAAVDVHEYLWPSSMRPTICSMTCLLHLATGWLRTGFPVHGWC